MAIVSLIHWLRQKLLNEILLSGVGIIPVHLKSGNQKLKVIALQLLDDTSTNISADVAAELHRSPRSSTKVNISISRIDKYRNL